MARAIWSGAISFGLVTIPVKLYSATSSHKLDFHQLTKDGERVRYQRIAEGSGKEVEYEDIVKGYELDEGQYVVVTPDELAAVEPTKSRTIDIEDFVDLDEIDPIAWDKTYYLAPTSDVGAERPYALLLQAMRETNKVAIARFVMRSKQYLATIRPIGDLLGLETMYFADEIRGADDVENVPGKVKVADREVAMARQLIESLTSEWKHEQYADTYQERVRELVKSKAEGKDIVVREDEETPQMADLMEALRASVEASTGKGGGAKSSGGGGKSKASKSATDYEDLTKDELYSKATEADVAGRSSMSKKELIAALEEAS